MDSLKQLALKFVYKKELEGFNFQRLFLCPFEAVFVDTQHKEIKVLVMDCIQNLVQARSAHIRSGWKSIFSVLALAAKDGSGGLAFPRQSWGVLSRLVDKEMHSLVHDFLDVIKVREGIHLVIHLFFSLALFFLRKVCVCVCFFFCSRLCFWLFLRVVCR